MEDESVEVKVDENGGMMKLVSETVAKLDKVAVAVRGWVTVTVMSLDSTEELVSLPESASAEEMPLIVAELSPGWTVVKAVAVTPTVMVVVPLQKDVNKILTLVLSAGTSEASIQAMYCLRLLRDFP